MKSGEGKSQNTKLQFSTDKRALFSTLDSQGGCHTRSGLLHITRVHTCLWSFLFFTLDSHLKPKYLVLVQMPPLSGKTWEGVPRCSTAEGRYYRHIAPPHSQMGKMKREAIVSYKEQVSAWQRPCWVLQHSSHLLQETFTNW